jgi:hypothetical protein
LTDPKFLEKLKNIEESQIGFEQFEFLMDLEKKGSTERATSGVAKRGAQLAVITSFE